MLRFEVHSVLQLEVMDTFHTYKGQTSFVGETSRVAPVCSMSLLYVHTSVAVESVYTKSMWMPVEHFSERFICKVSTSDNDAFLNATERLYAELFAYSW